MSTKSPESRVLSYGEEGGDYKIKLKFCLIGDLKFQFMVLGRGGFAGSWCLYCVLKKSEWARIHVEKNSINCGAEKHTIDGMMQKVLAFEQRNPGTRGQLHGQKMSPMWTFIPVSHCLFPLLHCLVLGLGNDLVKNFFEWIEVQVKKATSKEIQAQT